MSFWELFALVLSAAGLFASILGAFLTYAARKNGEATRALIRSVEDATRELIRGMEERMAALLERMDLRADERHREVTEALRSLKD